MANGLEPTELVLMLMVAYLSNVCSSLATSTTARLHDACMGLVNRRLEFGDTNGNANSLDGKYQGRFCGYYHVSLSREK